MSSKPRHSRREGTTSKPKPSSAAPRDGDRGLWVVVDRGANLIQWLQAVSPIYKIGGVVVVTAATLAWGLRDKSVPLWTALIPIMLYGAYKVGKHSGATDEREDERTHGVAAKFASFLKSGNDAIQAIQDAINGDASHLEDTLKDARSKLLKEICDMYPEDDLRCALLRVTADGSGGEVLVVAAGCHPGHRTKILKKQIELSTETLEGAAVLSGDAIYVPNIESDDRYVKLGDGKPVSVVCAPMLLFTGGRARGVLRVSAGAKDAFTGNDQVFIRGAALALAAMDWLIEGSVASREASQLVEAIKPVIVPLQARSEALGASGGTPPDTTNAGEN